VSKEATPIRLSETEGDTSWLPYSIVRRDDHIVVRGGLFNYLSGPLLSADTDQSVFMPTYGHEAISVTRVQHNMFQIGECGVVRMEEDACYFVRQDRKFVFRAAIPSPDKRDEIFTGMVHFGAAMASNGS